MEENKTLEIERGNTRLCCAENSLWKRLWACCKAENGLKNELVTLSKTLQI